MYKHKEELDELARVQKLREAQYSQVLDWLFLSKGVISEEERARWLSNLELWRGTALWARTNKQNYQRYYLSNTNEPMHLQTVYNAHTFWKSYELVNWRQWDSFFTSAQSWINAHQEQIRRNQNLTGPLEVRFNYLMEGRLKYALMTAEEKELLSQSEAPVWKKAFFWRQVARAVRFSARYGERLLRATFVFFLGFVLWAWFSDFKLNLHFVETRRLADGSLSFSTRRQDVVDYFTEQVETLAHKLW
eukprot:NODE_1325_length_1585_cov_22.407552_g1190_i0.p1 GENE.NODE_1325_length_1585_cov_22.407552_g1190_i0~~NODE_1325_length_1585_cov_22.407552_g1190_i0.p1  ORF type:complete len:247 (-),score=33.43 NODE_1325_length_1585_cov_22.407552_g1190_i0:104-844(-)